MMWIGLTSAQVEIKLYAYTDKPYYGYGEEGTLYVEVWNKESAVDLNYIKVEFPWENGVLWNFTYLEIDKPIGKGENKTYEITFKVPSESRSGWTNNDATVTLYYSGAGPATAKIKINVTTPIYNENIMPIYYLTAVLTTAVIIVIIELYFVWKRLSKHTAAPAAP